MRKFMLLLLGLYLGLGLFAQTRTLTGRVTDETGKPVANASVQVKGSSLGTTSDADGRFSLTVPSTARTLVFSAVGTTSTELTIPTGNTLNATLRSSEQSMQEVVVVGYGTQRKRELTGAVSTITAADIEMKPFTSVDKALQGQIAGLQSVASSGAPGANQQIRIRGISSINASSAPLTVIDGVPVLTNDISRSTTTANILATLNPNDVESVTVLKDAASASIYGSRAANGVILITTKKGRAGKSKFRFDAEVGYSDRAFENDRYRPLKAAEFLDLSREGLINAGVTQAQLNSTLTALGSGTNTDFDWVDAVTRTAKQQQYNLSASGGNDRTTYYLSGGYFTQVGTVVGSDMDRINGAMRVTTKATDKLSLTANINGGFVRQQTPLNGGAFGNPSGVAYFLLPTFSAYLPNGQFNILTPEFPAQGNEFNPLFLAKNDKRRLRETSLRGTGSAEYSFLPNLTFKSSLGGDLSSLEEDQYNNPLYGDGAVLAAGSPLYGPNVAYNPSTTGRASSVYTRYFNWVWTNTLSYRHKFTKDGDVTGNVLVGYESQKTSAYFNNLLGRGFIQSPAFLLQYPASTSTPTTASASISESSFVSQFSTLDLNFKDRYILSGSFRRDGSSRFGSNNKYGNFWSVGASWNVDREGFMQNITLVNQLKLRASYGVNGNAGIGNYDFFPGYSFGSSYNSAPGSAPSNVGNLDLTWELNKPFNIGLDIAVLKSRLSLTAEYYSRKSDDLLLDVPLSATTGFTSQSRNIGSMKNSGVELTLTGIPFQTKNFSWTSNFNFAHNKNEVLSLPSPQIGTNFIVRPGLDVQTFYVRVYAGVDPANGDPLWYADSTRKTTTNNYSAAARVPYGSASPKFFGGFTNTFSFKGFTVEAQLNYQFGNYIRDQWGGYFLGAGFSGTDNKVSRILERWQKPGDITDIPKYIYGGNKSFNSLSSFYLQKGDFIRLRNLQVGYSFPKTILSRINFTNAFLYVRGTNLYTWVKDKNMPWDPEQGITSLSNLDVFIPKTVTVGINLGF